MKSLENFLKILKNLLGLHAPPQPALHEGLAHHQAHLPKMGQRFHIRPKHDQQDHRQKLPQRQHLPQIHHLPQIQELGTHGQALALKI
jgi:hypothetical protein